MALTPGRASSGAVAASADVNQLIDALEGVQNVSYLLVSESGTNFLVRLADAAGARSFIIQDNSPATIFSVTSDGVVILTSYLRLKSTDTDGTTIGDMWLDTSEGKVKYVDASSVVTTIEPNPPTPLSIRSFM